MTGKKGIKNEDRWILTQWCNDDRNERWCRTDYKGSNDWWSKEWLLPRTIMNKNDECRYDRKETIVKEGKWDDEWMRRKEIDVRNEGRNKWEEEEGMKEYLPLSWTEIYLFIRKCLPVRYLLITEILTVVQSIEGYLSTTWDTYRRPVYWRLPETS